MFRELHPNIRARILIQFLSKVIGSMIFPFMAIYFSREINSSVAGFLLMINVLVQFLAGMYGGHLADIIGRKKLMVTGELLKVFAFLGMVLCNSPMFHSPWITFVMLLIIGVAQGLINPAGEAMLIDVSTPENRSFMYSVSYWANNLSIMIGIMVGGLVFCRLSVSSISCSFYHVICYGMAYYKLNFRDIAAKRNAAQRVIWTNGNA